MSVFKVKLTNNSQGLLDTAGQSAGVSKQRSVYLMGPNKINRLLHDGDTITDSNYYKRFVAAPSGTATLETAILDLVTDDGSVFSSNPSENVFPKVYNMTVASGSTYSTVNTMDILGDTGSYAVYCQITVSGHAVKCRINGTAIIDISTSIVQVFNPGDLNITKLEFDNTAGGGTAGTVQVFLSIKSVSNT